MEDEKHIVDHDQFKYDLAATYLEDAISSRHTEFNPSPDGLRVYKLYKIPWLRYLLYTAFLLDVSLAFFEEPAADGWLWPTWATLTLEFICLIFFMGRLFHELMVCLNAKIFWKDAKHVTNAGILLLTIIDICIYVGMTEAGSDKAIRFSRPLRPFLLVNFTEARQIRRAFRTIRRSLPELGNVLILFMASLTLFSLMAVKLFGKRGLDNGNEEYFGDFFDAFWQLYVLVTTANSPDIMMPAYNSNRAYIIFFAAFLLINLYLFMRVFLAVIYKSYKDNLKAEVREAVQLKRDLLKRSYQLIGDRLNKTTFKTIMREASPGRTEEFWEVAWLILDPTGNGGHLPPEEFHHITDLLDLQVVDIRVKHPVWLPQIYNSAPSKLLIKGVRHIAFRYVFDIIIFVNALFIAFDLDGGEPFFLALFSLEILLKLYAFGFRAFVRKLWNIFDTLVVSSAIIVSIVEAARGSHNASEVALDFLMVLRVIRIFRIFHSIDRFKIVINTILHILPSMATYLGVLLVFYYSFAIIGMEAFGGLVNSQGNLQYCGNPLLQDSAFWKDNYCSNNFNDLFSALVTLFELMTVNQWHVITQGFVRVTDKSARLYFFAFHLICVTVILNIFSAFVIEAFILEFNVTTAGASENDQTASAASHPTNSPLLSPLMKRIAGMGLGYSKSLPGITSGQAEDLDVLVEADHSALEAGNSTELNNPPVPGAEENPWPDHSRKTGLRFYLTSRTRTVMGLLEKMFEADLEQDEAVLEARGISAQAETATASIEAAVKDSSNSSREQ